MNKKSTFSSIVWDVLYENINNPLTLIEIYNRLPPLGSPPDPNEAKKQIYRLLIGSYKHTRVKPAIITRKKGQLQTYVLNPEFVQQKADKILSKINHQLSLLKKSLLELQYKNMVPIKDLQRICLYLEEIQSELKQKIQHLC